MRAPGGQQLVDVDRGQADGQRILGVIDVSRQRIRRVDRDRAAKAQHHRFAEQGDLDRRRLDLELRRQEFQRVDLDRVEEDLGAEFGQHRFEMTCQQGLQVDHVEQLQVLPANRDLNAPVVAASAMLDRAQHLLEGVERQVGVGEDQVELELGPDQFTATEIERRQAEAQAGVGDGQPAGGCGAVAGNEVFQRLVGPAQASLETDVVALVADRDRGQHDLTFQIRHLGVFERRDQLGHLALGRHQLVPVAGVGVVDLAQVQRRRRTAHVAVNAAFGAASLMVFGQHHLVAELDVLLASRAVEINLRVLAIACCAGFTGRRRHHQGVGDHAGHVVCGDLQFAAGADFLDRSEAARHG